MTIDGIRWRLSNQTRGHAAPADVEELPTFTVGDVCLAPRVFDRRRARAIVEKVDSDKGTCLVTWVYPRQKGELPCRYWKEVGKQFMCISRTQGAGCCAMPIQNNMFLLKLKEEPLNLECLRLMRLPCVKNAPLLYCV